MIPESRLTKRVKIPEGVEVNLDGIMSVKGPNGEVKKELDNPSIELLKENDEIVIKPKRFTKRQKTLINTFEAHVKNMFKGVTEGFTYKLKVCSSHFPMTVNVEGNMLVIKNFLGEKVPRKAKILGDVKVDLKGDDITITGADREAVGQTAANFEQSTRITNRDRRRF